MNSSSHYTLVWLRQDLRLYDNQALYHASKLGHIVPIYILDPTITLGGAAKWWLHYSLDSLKKDLASQGIGLIIRHGNPVEVLAQLIEEIPSQAVYWNQVFTPDELALDIQVKQLLTQKQIRHEHFNSSLLHAPHEITNSQGKFFQIFTPYWKQCLTLPEPANPLGLPKFTAHTIAVKSLPINDLQLLPKTIDWTQGLVATWQVSETQAINYLKEFVEDKLPHYAQERDFPAKDVSSHLSPYLHFGQISPRQIWHYVQQASFHHAIAAKSSQQFLAELGWREFSYHLLNHFPKLPTSPFRAKFEQFPWVTNTHFLKAWQRGQTGYPIVDAGIRQLWHTGIMHNRVRMIVASFLTKHLLLPWQLGAEWFLDTLVDADLAANSFNWQWVAGCGADAAPYFRIFNPILQGQKFDAAGHYVKQWIPELSELSSALIHTPWKADQANLTKANIILGTTYPMPIVDHEQARANALAAYKKITTLHA